MNAQNPGRAIIFFKNALEKDQNYFDARFQLAKTYSAIGKFDSAEKEETAVTTAREIFRKPNRRKYCLLN